MAARKKGVVAVVVAAASALTAPLLAQTPAVAQARPPHQQGDVRHDHRDRERGVPALPLGSAQLEQTVTEQALAPGVRLTTITRGHGSAADSWVLRSLQPSRAAADALAARLRAASPDPGAHPTSVRRIDQRAADDPSRGPLGYLVVSAGYPSEAGAKQAQASLAGAGITGLGVSNTALYEPHATGPWVVRALTVDHRHLRQVRAHLATDIVPGRETTSSVANRIGALAAVNGGYFVVGSADGVPGDPAGVAVQDGWFDSEAVADRAALILNPKRSAIAAVTTRLQVRATDGSVHAVAGLDRRVGQIRDCGEPGDLPTVAAQQDITCTNPDEIVSFDSAFGRSAEPGPGAAATVDGHGRVIGLATQRGGDIPAGGRVLEGIGAGASWLRAHAHLGQRLAVVTNLGADGRPLRLTPDTGIVNGGPFLVRNAHVAIDAFHEGFVHPDDPGFYYAFAVSRNPRTMAGITEDGDLLLVTVDGRNPGYSIGLSFAEQARVMQALGSRVALNLDGGGSTTMVASGALLGRPSDSTGERPVGDVIAVLTARRRDS